MKKVSVIGLDTAKESLISQLLHLGCVQINDQAVKLQDETIGAIAERDGSEDQAVKLDAESNRLAIAIKAIEDNTEIKTPLFFTRKEIGLTDFNNIVKNRKSITKKVDRIIEKNDKLHTIQEKINKGNTDLAMLEPWQAYDVPLEIRETKHTDIDLGFVPITCDLEELEAAIKEDNEYTAMKEISRDQEMVYLGILSTKRDVEFDIISFLKQWGYTPMPFGDFKGTAAENKKRIEKEIAKMEKEADKIREDLASHADELFELKCLKDQVDMEADHEKIKTSLIKTKRTFYLEGWVPETAEERVEKVLLDSGCSYEITEPAEGEEPPVLLNTTKFAFPFQAITEMYSLPNYDGFDPTNIFAVFYAFFFGIMLSDAGYGAVLTIACWVILKKYPLEGTMEKMFKMFLMCGIFTVFWGVMFGGYFGDLIQVWASTVFGKTIEIKALWFNPMDDPTKLLIFSLLFGCVHLFIGMGIDMYMKIKRGHTVDAILDQVPWFMVIIGAGCWLGGSAISQALIKPGMVLTIAGLVVLLLTGGRHSESIIGKVAGGLSSVYGITGWISDILSYARLLALGLATGVIASVVNLLGSMVGSGVKGAIALLIIGLFGHVFSMAINVLGAFVHSSRLQYVEFFGKFYEDGGEPFRPFFRDTSYVKIDDDK